MIAAVDFLRPRRTPMLGWVLLGVGIACAATAWQLDQRWNAERAAREAQTQKSQAAWRRARELATRPKVPSADERRTERAWVILQRPWLATLRAIEGVTQDPVYLLGLSIDPATGRVQVDGEAPSFDHALAYVQRLDEDGALVPAQLVSHDSLNDAIAIRNAVRFSAVTQWRLP